MKGYTGTSTMTDFDITILQGKTDAPPRVYHTFGLMTVETIYKVWQDCEDGKRRPLEATKEEYIAAGGGELSFAFVIANAGEFNPKLKDQYRRKVDTSKGTFGRDWREIVKPSLVALVGDGDYSHLLGAVHNKYVQVKDAPQASGSMRDDGTPWNTLAFVKVYGSRDECAADALVYQAQFVREDKSNGNNGAQPVTFQRPTQYSVKVWETTIIPAIKADLASGVSVEEIAAGHEIDKLYVVQFVSGGVPF